MVGKFWGSARVQGQVCIVLGTFGFAAKGVVIKLAYGYGVSAGVLLSLRMLVALPCYVGIALWLGRQGLPRLEVGDRGKIVGLGLLSYYASSIFDFIGLQYLSAGLERLLLYMYPTLVVLISAVWLGERLVFRQYVGLVGAYVGIFLVFAEDLRFGGRARDTWVGSGWVLMSTVCFAVFVVLAAPMMRRVGSTRFTAYAMMSACTGVLVHGGIFHGLGEFRQPWVVYGLSVILGLFCTVIPSFLMNRGMSLLGGSQSAMLGSVGPVITIFLGASVLGERVGVWQWLGTVVIVLSVGLTSGRRGG